MCGEKLENYNYDFHDPDHDGHIDHDHIVVIVTIIKVIIRNIIKMKIMTKIW